MSFGETLAALADEPAILLGLALALALALVATPLAGRLARRVGGVDVPGDRPRVHSQPIPRTGGLAIVLAIVVPTLLFVELDGALPGVLIGLGGMAAVGLFDDVRGLRPSTKLAASTLVVLIPVAGWDMTYDRVMLRLLGDGDLGVGAYQLTVLWIVLVAKLVNLIDGLAALAEGIVSIA